MSIENKEKPIDVGLLIITIICIVSLALLFYILPIHFFWIIIIAIISIYYTRLHVLVLYKYFITNRKKPISFNFKLLLILILLLIIVLLYMMPIYSFLLFILCIINIYGGILYFTNFIRNK